MNKKLIELRHSAKLSQASAATKIGISQSMLSSLESGQRQGTDKIKSKVAKFYGKSVQYIFFSD
ncbi:MAG: helix-turn-helix transcriptional regulator [Lactobacillus sp.]|nr:helix-turn-helix transcriptional regulator [Lactobacillus sp.]